MKGKKCQVCAGPIVNGRCKLCGMPYRNDEVLYHLNENKEKHYEHATQKAREIMRQQQIPLGDNKKPRNTYQNVESRNKKQTLTKDQGKKKNSGRALWFVALIYFILMYIARQI